MNATIFITLLVARGALAPAPPAKAASESLALGMAMYRAGNFEAALAAFQRSHDIQPAHQVLYQIGRTHEQLGDYLAAIKAFRRHLLEGGAAVKQSQRDAVEYHIQRISKQLAWLHLTVSPSDAHILVDDRPIGRAPLALPVPVNPGRHRVRAVAAGMRAASRQVTVAAGDRLPLTLQLNPLTPPPVAVLRVPTPTVDQPAPSARQGGPLWAVVGVSSALAAGAGAFGIAATFARGDFERELQMFPGSHQRLDRARSRLHRLAVLTDLCAAAAIVGSLASVYLRFARF